MYLSISFFPSFGAIPVCFLPRNTEVWEPLAVASGAGYAGPATEVVGTNDEQEGISFMKKKEFPKMSNRL